MRMKQPAFLSRRRIGGPQVLEFRREASVEQVAGQFAVGQGFIERRINGVMGEPRLQQALAQGKTRFGLAPRR